MTRSLMPFVYPVAHPELFRDLPGRIVKALEERNWDVPGVVVKFRVHGTGDAKRRTVSSIRNGDLMMEFTVSGDLMRLVSGKQDLNIWWNAEGFSSMSLAVYGGFDWETDREWFVSQSSKCHGERNGDPRYLSYKGKCGCENLQDAIFTGLGSLRALWQGDGETLLYALHEHQGVVPPLLVFTDNHYGTEYLPGESDPLVLQTADVFGVLATDLAHLLATLTACALPAERIDVFAEKPALPWLITDGLFCFGTEGDRERIQTGRQDSLALAPQDRYGMRPHDHTFLSGCRGLDRYPDAIEDGVLLAAVGDPTNDAPPYMLEIPGHKPWSEQRYVLRITPNRADGIYIADWAARGDPANWGEGGRTIADLNLLDTFIPISKYNDTYGQPVVVSTRELDFDEVEIWSGPWPDQPPTQHRRRS